MGISSTEEGVPQKKEPVVEKVSVKGKSKTWVSKPGGWEWMERCIWLAFGVVSKANW